MVPTAACLKTKSQTWRNCPMAGVVGALFLFHLKNYPFAGKKAFTIKDTIRMPKPPFTIKDTIRMPKPPGARVVNASSQARESNNRGEKPPPPPRHGKAIIEARNPDTATEELHHRVRCSPRQPGSVPGTVLWSRYRGYCNRLQKPGVEPVPSGSTRSSTTVPVFHGPIPTARLGRGPRKPGVQTYSSSESRVARELGYDTVTRLLDHGDKESRH